MKVLGASEGAVPHGPSCGAHTANPHPTLHRQTYYCLQRSVAGCPLGPAAFDLALDPIIQKIQSPLNIWYLDDGTIAGLADFVADDLAILAIALPTISLELNCNKC